MSIEELADEALARSIDTATTHVLAATEALPLPCPVCGQLPCEAVTRPPDAITFGYAESDE